MPTTPLLPLPDGLDITAISATEEGLLVRVTSTRPTSLCPVCSTPSSTVHSSYRRKPLDLPCAGQPIRLLLSVRKFFCRADICPRKIFTEQLPELIKPSSRPTRRSLLDPYRAYLLTRWMQGEHNGNQLTREIRSQGYQGCDTLARELITQLRKTYPDVAALPRTQPSSQQAPPPPLLVPKSSPRQIRWLLIKKREELSEAEQAELTRLLEGSEEVRLIYRLLQTFLQMIRERQAEYLDAWMKEARSSGIKELHSFVAGIERDYDAVKAGLTLKWSQGPVEGTVNKLKVHKRLMYGRAGFPLLRKKMLHCS
jgi:transposase